MDEGNVVVTTKSGERVELRSRSTDVGRGFRGLVVEDRSKGSVELDWDDIDRVDFEAAPSGAAPLRAERLYGTVRTRAGVEATGFVAWDLDEALTSDILDGEEDGRDRDVAFDSIVRIAPDGRRSARVTLRSGEEIVLRGTNDVNSENRGIEVSDPGLGRLVVEWDDLESVSFRAQPTSVAPYASFDGGRPLQGTVETRSGARVTGRIRWSNREERTWQTLDGRLGDARVSVELARIDSVERAGEGGMRITLEGGRVLAARATSDEDGGGIFVKPDAGPTVLVRWDDFDRATFEP